MNVRTLVDKTRKNLVLTPSRHYPMDDDQVPYVASFLSKILEIEEDKALRIVQKLREDRETSIQIVITEDSAFWNVSDNALKVLKNVLDGLTGLGCETQAFDSIEI